MKRTIFFILIICIHLDIFAQHDKVIQLTYPISLFDIQENDGVISIESDFLNLFFSGDTLSPEIPFVYLNIPLDANKEFDEIFVSCEDSLIKKNVSIRSNTPIVEVSNTNNKLINYYSKNVYNNQNSCVAQLTGVYKTDGMNLIGLRIFPFRFDSASRRLFLNKIITVTVKQHDVKVQSYYGDNSFMDDSDKSILNEECSIKRYSNYTDSVDYEYIIITPQSFLTPFDRLANWKTMKGVRTKVLTIEEINSQYSGSTLQMRIKNAIKNYYDGAFHGLKYVLLAGNCSIVPTQLCYIKFNNLNDTTPTDMFYSCFDSMDWDCNGNGVLGEIEDSIDITPEITIARLPVSSISDSNTIVDRIINYERWPNIEDWQDNILMCGRYTVGTPQGNALHSNVEIDGQYLFNNIIQSYWPNVQRVRLYDTCTDFPDGAEYEFSAQHLQTELGKGYSIAYIDTHGIEEAYQMENEDWDYRYSTEYSDSLINLGVSTIITTACYTNAFDFPLNLGRSFFHNPNSGILFYVGCSRKNWYPHIRNYYRTFFQLLLSNQSQQLAVSFKDLKIGMASSADSYGNPGRWLLYALNILGDPEMPLFFSEPKKFNNVILSMQNDSLFVNTGVDGCRICIKGNEEAHNDYYEIVKDVHQYSFSGIGESGTLCITKPDYIPYIALYGQTVYIQNETENHDIHVISNEVNIGSDVTNTKPHGPVIVEEGKTKITSNQIFIKNNFEVKKGASLEIQPQ
jgi:hypothetical protein